MVASRAETSEHGERVRRDVVDGRLDAVGRVTTQWDRIALAEGTR